MKRWMVTTLGLIAVTAFGVAIVLYSGPRIATRTLGPVWEDERTVITMLCSDEKAEWIRRAADEFSEARNDIDLEIMFMSSVDGMNALLSREETPTLWSPAGGTLMSYLAYRWEQEFGVTPFRAEGEDAPRSLARSPVVWLSWKSRIEVLEEAIAAGTLQAEQVWAEIGCAGVPRDPDATWSAEPARWNNLTALQAAEFAATSMTPWGVIEFAYADPTRSPAGLMALYLMTYQFLGQPERVVASELEEYAHLTWFRRCQRLRSNFLNSTPLLTNRIFQFGPSRYDVVVSYENLAIRHITTAGERWSEEARIYYPPVSMWSDHPVVILDSEVLPRAQRDAARDWIEFLLTPAQQRSLISFGLRPSDENISIRESVGENNPFSNSGRYGVQLDPRFDSPPGPEGRAIEKLEEIWRKATGYY